MFIVYYSVQIVNQFNLKFFYNIHYIIISFNVTYIYLEFNKYFIYQNYCFPYFYFLQWRDCCKSSFLKDSENLKNIYYRTEGKVSYISVKKFYRFFLEFLYHITLFIHNTFLCPILEGILFPLSEMFTVGNLVNIKKFYQIFIKFRDKSVYFDTFLSAMKIYA